MSLQMDRHIKARNDAAEILHVFDSDFHKVRFVSNKAIVIARIAVLPRDLSTMAELGWEFYCLCPDTDERVKLFFSRRGL